MSQADIILPLAGDTQAWIYAEAVEITRQGTRSVTGVPGINDKWRISLPISACLAQNGAALTDASGAEIPIPVPAGSVACSGCDVADILHDAEVQQVLQLVKSITMRLMSGALQPIIPEEAP